MNLNNKSNTMKKIFVRSLALVVLLLQSVGLMYAVDYSLGGYLNGSDVNGYNSSWKMTASGNVYTITKTFTATDNYFWIFDSNGTKYGVDSYTEKNPSTLKQNANEKVGAKGLSTSSATTITFNPSNLQISWSNSSGGGTGNLKEPYVISVYIQDQWDEQYTFTKVPGSTNYEYEVSFEIPNYNPDADYKFWVGCENSWSDTYSENKSLKNYVSDCSTGSFSAKIYALSEDGQPHGSNYKNFGIHDFKCTESSAKLTLSSNVREFDKAEPPANITLTAQADEKTEGKYIWYKSDDEGATYTKLGETTSASYQLNYTPSNTRNYFKVERKKVDSNDMVSAITVIYTVQSCGEDSKGSNIFREDFGELTAVRGNGSRSSFPGVVSGYTYQPAPKKINESFYAVVADPYYCGCGEGSDMNESVTDECLGRNAWFRQLRDHTLMNTGNTGPYGGMLLLNFKEKGIAYERELTDAEKHDITKNSILKFSAYFASAAKKDPSFIAIDMQLIIQFKKTNTTTWVNASEPIESHVNFDDGWQRAEVEWKVEDADGDFRVVIINDTDSGNGNDLLVDDISLDLCTPAFALYFVDEEGNMFEDQKATSIDDIVKVQVQQIDFGTLGTDPCMQLYQRIVNGTDTSYTYLSDLTLSEGYYITDVLANSIFTEVPGTVEMVAVASAKDNGTCVASVKTGVEAGEYKPGQQTNVVFSGNYLTYTIGCGTSLLTLSEGENSSICLTDDLVMPKLTLSSTNVGTVMKMDVLVDDTVILTNIPYSSEINITELYKANNAGSIYYPEIGERTITVKVREYNEEGEVFCERLANGEVKIIVLGNSAAPVLNRDGEIYAYNMCKTEIPQDKFFFNDLVVQPTDKSSLVWLTKNNQIIPAAEAFFYADVVQEDSVKLYNNPVGSCPSDTIVVRYRVKEFTPAPQFVNYKECATEETSKPLSDLVTNASTYKYLLFLNEDSVAVTTFNPSAVGEADYKIIASLDEINSAVNNYCEATDTINIKVKGNATAANIAAKDTTVCPGAELILIAKADFAEEQSNVKLTWYADTTYNRTFAYGETFKYYLLDEAYKQSPDTVYLTVQSDDYCENKSSEAKPVVIYQKEAVPSLAISPTSAEVVIGAMPKFTVTPDDAKYVLYVNDVKVSSDATTYKPYLDSEYKLVYQGDCGTSSATANVEVKWPTVFTPYVTDGRNDTFVQDMDPNFYTQIFTRFGTKIYEGPNGWNGSINGSMNGNAELAAPGVYYYVVQLPDGNVKKGTIEVFKY